MINTVAVVLLRSATRGTWFNDLDQLRGEDSAREARLRELEAFLRGALGIQKPSLRRSTDPRKVAGSERCALGGSGELSC